MPPTLGKTNKLNVDINNTHWESIFQSTKEIGLRALQWKNVYAIYHANILLNKMGIENSDKCNACHSNDKDYITHFFVYICQSKTNIETSERLEWEMKTKTNTEH